MWDIDAAANDLLYKNNDFMIFPGQYKTRLNKAFAILKEKKIIDRIWDHDHTIWKDDPGEIINRLGWLRSPEMMKKNVREINSFTTEICHGGYTNAILLGMGGSSLAPEVFRKVFGIKKGFLDLSILDSTHPEAIRKKETSLDYLKTIFIVSTKSGGTVETLSLLKYFYNQSVRHLGKKDAGKIFVAITDPGSRLESLGRDFGFKKIFLNDPDIGGRFSVLSYFGLVPAALMGLDLTMILENAQRMIKNHIPQNGTATDLTAAWLGAVLGDLAMIGVDKLTLITSPGLSFFCPWIEQLVAESTGKDGKGILPVLSKTIDEPGHYKNDRLFVYLQLEGDHTHDLKIKKLMDSNIPVAWMALKDIDQLSGEFFRWEMATAIACAFMEINPFNQPNVESAKLRARETLAAYQTEGKLPQLNYTHQFKGIEAVSDLNAGNLSELLEMFFVQASSTRDKKIRQNYIAIHAYMPITLEMDATLAALRTRIENKYRIAVTVGYGPRFLHSTGQLHKGDAGNGFFIQLTDESREDIPIPDELGDHESSVSFRVLIDAQAIGDRQALIESGRKVIHFHLKDNVIDTLKMITGEL